jgi:hypothetical protein
MSEVSPVALAVLLGQGSLSGDTALHLVQLEFGGPGGGGASGGPGAGGGAGGGHPPGDGALGAGLLNPATPADNTPAVSTTAGNTTAGNTTAGNAPAADQGADNGHKDIAVSPPPQTPAPQPLVTGNTGHVVIEEPQAPANAPDPATAPPDFIWLTGNPNAGMAQIMSYAESYHPLLDRPAISPAADLVTALDIYSSNGIHPKLVVFDSNAINLSFFEFAQGVLMVSDHELGYTPGANALAMATIVELSNGAQMHILGVLDVTTQSGF